MKESIKRLAVLGSTGSIGKTTLEIVESFPEHFSVVALAAGKNLSLLEEQIRRFQPVCVSVADAAAAKELQKTFPKLTCVYGSEGLKTVATFPEADMVIAAVVGFAGMESTLAAIEAGKDVGLANKEAMITAGPLMVSALKRSSGKLLPIDSEHNAVFQCLEGAHRSDWKRILLTCSGGPFRELPKEAFRTITVEQALKHPNWVMGRKITIDSATLMNKALEMIEAHFLFDARSEQIDVVIHPESIVHSMVEWVDGAVTASLGETTMKGPIAHVLHYPRRLPGVLKSLPWGQLRALHFSDPDPERFPSLTFARQCLEREGNAPVLLSAANEVAVDAFLSAACPFTAIYDTIDHVLQKLPWHALETVEGVKEFDRQARETASAYLRGRKV